MGAKHRKTLKQKMIADYRHNSYTYLPPSDVTTASTITKSIPTYSYILRDISKTGILTLVLIALQIILFLFLKNHILKIPGIIY